MQICTAQRVAPVANIHCLVALWLGCTLFMLLHLQVLGLDYLVDSEGHPWLLEVNGTPSLAVAHHDPTVKQLIQETKVGSHSQGVR